MKIKLLLFFALAVSLLVFCHPTFAHHGTNASYDITKHITLTGTVTEFAWANPHLQVYFDVKDDAGKVVHWAGEIPPSPYAAKRAGWTRDIMKPGDQITISGSPSRSGSANMVVRKIVLPSGKALEMGGGGAE